MKRTNNKSEKPKGESPIPEERWWEERARAARAEGRIDPKRKFVDAQDLWDAASEYFEWVQNHPLYSTHTFKIHSKVVTQDVPYDRPFTVNGLCLYLGISNTTLNEYYRREDFQETVEMIYQVISTQKYEGAVVGIFNPMIIARDLKMKDGTEVSGPNEGAIETENRNSNTNKDLDPSDLPTDDVKTMLDIIDRNDGQGKHLSKAQAN